MDGPDGRSRGAGLGTGRVHAWRKAHAARETIGAALARQIRRYRRAGRRFVDIAEQAGLRAPVIYGGAKRKNYILETVGCGVAFIDYDNDGWLDIFILSGTCVDNPPAGAHNRLYKNNLNGTFTDVTEQAGLKRSGWASAVCVGDYDNDGFDDLFI